jgi:hypothetical protein
MRMFTSADEGLHKSTVLSGCVAGKLTSSLLVKGKAIPVTDRRGPHIF